MSTEQRRITHKATKAVAAVAAVAALALGADAVAGNGSSSASANAGGLPGGAAGGGMPGLGTPVTGATLAKLAAAVAAKHPGTVERAMRLPDGSYVVQVVRSSGEVHVRVSKGFRVTGVDRGGPAGGAPPAGLTPPSGTTPPTVDQ